MSFAIFIFFVVIAIGMAFLQHAGHEEKIHEQVEAYGGKVIHIEHKTFSTGPFMVVGKGRTVYRFEYRVGEETREGWVRFGGLFGPDWRM